MKRVSLIIAAVAAMTVFASSPLAAEEITITPNVINIASESEVVTVHTDLAFSLVTGTSVTLNGIEIASWKYDNQGNFVAKFSSDEVKSHKEVADAGAAGIYVTLTLEGTYNGEPFIATDEVKVISVEGKRK